MAGHSPSKTGVNALCPGHYVPEIEMRGSSPRMTPLWIASSPLWGSSQ
jgi:hypothetical protein